MSRGGDLAILDAGMVTPVGQTADASCAAIRSKLTNPMQTAFLDENGDWVVAFQVTLEEPWRGRPRLARMAAMAVEEALAGVPRRQWPDIPMLLCVAEPERPGRTEGLDDQLALEIQGILKVSFARGSGVIAAGRTGVACALRESRAMVEAKIAPLVLIVGVDSLTGGAAMAQHERRHRLLTPGNSNGFIPGEAAGALLVGVPTGRAELLCSGLGFATEPAPIGSGQPFRADGLTHAMRAALADAGWEMADLDLRVGDISGEQYYFKEAALALTRLLRERKSDLELWHPAECIGEAGAAVGPVMIGLARSACRKRFAPGPRIVAQMGTDAGQRAAVALRYGGAHEQ